MTTRIDTSRSDYGPSGPLPVTMIGDPAKIPWKVPGLFWCTGL